MHFGKKLLLVAVGSLAAILLINDAVNTKLDAELMQNEYCEMVKLYKDTKQEQGWPDYRGKYKELCK